MKIHERAGGDRRDELDTTTPMAGKQYIILLCRNNKEAYTDRSKNTGNKVNFAAVFTDIIRRGALPEEASIHTAEMTAMIEKQKIEHMRWIIYTHSLSSMLTIENNRENYLI